MQGGEINGNYPAGSYGQHAPRPPSNDGDDENETIEEEDEGEEENLVQSGQRQSYYQHQVGSASPSRSISQNRTRALRYRKAFMGK